MDPDFRSGSSPVSSPPSWGQILPSSSSWQFLDQSSRVEAPLSWPLKKEIRPHTLAPSVIRPCARLWFYKHKNNYRAGCLVYLSPWSHLRHRKNLNLYTVIISPFNESRTGAEMSWVAYQRSTIQLMVESDCESKRELGPPPWFEGA